jgi:nucleoside-diphosphate-sugar epimerase
MTVTDWPSRFGQHFEHQPVLITGGAGFIGSHLAEALLRLGAEVRILDDLSGGDEANLRAIAHATGRDPHFVQASINDEPALREVVSGCRYVFHQAALGSVPASVAEPAWFHQVNDAGTQQVLEAARQAGVKRLMFAASSAAYGNSEALPKRETMPVEPMSPYAATKVAGEALVRAYANSYDLDAVALRYFNIFGPRQNANSAYAAVIAAFAHAMLADKPTAIHGDGEQSRDFTFVDNVVEANLRAACAETDLSGQVLNIGTGRRISINLLHQQMNAALGRDQPPRYDPPRPGDVRHSQADITRTRQAIGFEPIVDLDTGLAQTLDWYRSQVPAKSP